MVVLFSIIVKGGAWSHIRSKEIEVLHLIELERSRVSDLAEAFQGEHPPL